MNKEQFAKCPFCGKSETLTIGKASDAFSEPDDCGDPMPYMHTESYAVTCDASKPDGPGGCGASGGYKLTEDEAIAAWNRRAALAQHQAKALEGVEPIGYIAWRDGKPAWSEDCVCEDAVFPRDIEDDCTSMAIYPATTVSALQARIAELESELRRVTTSPPTGSAPCARLCEHMAFQIQAKSDARRIAELEQDAVRGEPVGFVMVPVEPTPDMLEAGAGTKYEKRARNVWRDMIAAAAPKGTT